MAESASCAVLLHAFRRIAGKPVDIAAIMINIDAEFAVVCRWRNGEALPERFKPHSFKAVACDARSHVDASLRKAGRHKNFPAFGFLARSKFSRPPASSAPLRPAVPIANRRAV